MTNPVEKEGAPVAGSRGGDDQACRGPGPRMIDVADKEPSLRMARAEGFLALGPATLERIAGGQTPKGNVFEVSRLAGVMGAKLTPRLVPLCHPVSLTSAEVTAEAVDSQRVRFVSCIVARDRTGVEMEALSAVGAAALAFYDMIKSIDRSARIESIRLLEKSGGRSGHFVAPSPAEADPGR